MDAGILRGLVVAPKALRSHSAVAWLARMHSGATRDGKAKAASQGRFTCAKGLSDRFVAASDEAEDPKTREHQRVGFGLRHRCNRRTER